MSDDSIKFPKGGQDDDPFLSNDPKVQADLQAMQDSASAEVRRRKGLAAQHAARQDREVLALLPKDWLSETARKERRNLLSGALLGIVIALTGVVPSEIFGLHIESGNRQSLLTLGALVALYLVVSFGFYAFADYLKHQQQVKAAIAMAHYNYENDPPPYKGGGTILDALAETMAKIEPGSQAAWMVNHLRIAIDFAFPIVVGLAAAVSLWLSSPAPPPDNARGPMPSAEVTAESPLPLPSAARQSPQSPTDEPPRPPPSPE